jgi:hypothetical protein
MLIFPEDDNLRPNGFKVSFTTNTPVAGPEVLTPLIQQLAIGHNPKPVPFAFNTHILFSLMFVLMFSSHLLLSS